MVGIVVAFVLLPLLLLDRCLNGWLLLRMSFAACATAIRVTGCLRLWVTLPLTCCRRHGCCCCWWWWCCCGKQQESRQQSRSGFDDGDADAVMTVVIPLAFTDAVVHVDVFAAIVAGADLVCLLACLLAFADAITYSLACSMLVLSLLLLLLLALF